MAFFVSINIYVKIYFLASSYKFQKEVSLTEIAAVLKHLSAFVQKSECITDVPLMYSWYISDVIGWGPFHLQLWPFFMGGLPAASVGRATFLAQALGNHENKQRRPNHHMKKSADVMDNYIFFIYQLKYVFYIW